MDYTVGDLARRTGLTTRTLHHYETLGLLRPAQRTPSGYRLYDDTNLAQLHKVLALRYFGLPLKDIATALSGDQPPMHALLRDQAALVAEQIRRQQRLLEALTRCAEAVEDGSVARSEELFSIINAMRLCEESLSEAEHATLARARAALTDSDLRALQAEAATLLQAMEAQRIAGADPASASVQALVRRSADVRDRLTNGDPGVHAKLREIGQAIPELVRARGVSAELMDYLRAARAAFESAEAARPAKARSSRRGSKS